MKNVICFKRLEMQSPLAPPTRLLVDVVARVAVARSRHAVTAATTVSALVQTQWLPHAVLRLLRLAVLAPRPRRVVCRRCPACGACSAMPVSAPVAKPYEEVKAPEAAPAPAPEAPAAAPAPAPAPAADAAPAPAAEARIEDDRERDVHTTMRCLLLN